eukprot:1395334-Amorphochlora_amoeboformis.AAC.2
MATQYIFSKSRSGHGYTIWWLDDSLDSAFWKIGLRNTGFPVREAFESGCVVRGLATRSIPPARLDPLLFSVVEVDDNNCWSETLSPSPDGLAVGAEAIVLVVTRSHSRSRFRARPARSGKLNSPLSDTAAKGSFEEDLGKEDWDIRR